MYFHPIKIPVTAFSQLLSVPVSFKKMFFIRNRNILPKGIRPVGHGGYCHHGGYPTPHMYILHGRKYEMANGLWYHPLWVWFREYAVVQLVVNLL